MPTDESVLRYLTIAKRTGVARDQLQLFCAGGYVPQPKQMAFHAACRECDGADGPTEIGFGGARGPGKTHALLAQLSLDDCQRRPGLKVLLLRRVGKAVRESLEDLRVKVMGEVKHNYNRSSGTVTFPNSSRIIVGHFKDERDIDNYLGLEYDVIGVEEATTLSAAKYRAIRTCNRTSRDDWRPRMYTTTNPGGVGHVWYKVRFVEPFRAQEETETRFIPATVDDNVFINEGYRRTLEQLTGWRKRAWLMGDWDISAGQYFTNFHYPVHAVEPMPVPEYWPYKWLAMDYGWTHPTAVILFAMSNEGAIYVVDEYKQAKRVPKTHSKAILDMLKRWDLRTEDLDFFVGGGDMWQRDRNGKCAADDYLEVFPMLERADMGRVSGASNLVYLLGDPHQGVEPKLFFYKTCDRTMSQLSSMQHNPNLPDDVLKTDVDSDGTGGDDLYDALRYGAMVVDLLRTKKVEMDVLTY